MNAADQYKTFIKTNFNEIKSGSKADYPALFPIYDEQKNRTGYLRPLTQDYKAAIPDCIPLLTAWRNANPLMSTGSFAATNESTKRWIDLLVIGRDDRILFLIIANDGTKIGQIGLSSFHYDEQSCEIDAVIRGVPSGYKGMMTYALRTLVNWGLDVLKLKKIILRVVCDNKRAIDFYSRNYFYKIEPECIPTIQGRYYIGMQLNIDAWKQAGL